MKAIRIVKIGQIKDVETQYGTKQKVWITFRDASFTDPKHNIEGSMFVPKGGIWFKVEDVVLADIVVSGQYVNIKKVEKFESDKPVTSADTPVPTATTPEVKEEKTKETPMVKTELTKEELAKEWINYSKSIKSEKIDWEGKERRMIRMNCLRHATELVKDIQSFQETRNLDKMIQETKDVAGKLEEWVYRPR